jgi:hypothetical protein
MALIRFLFKGTARNVGRFGPLNPGDVISLTEAEADVLTGNASFERLPDNAITGVQVAKTGNYTVVSPGDSGKTFLMNQTAGAATLTLPASPAAGFRFEAIIGTAATQNTIVAPGATYPIVDAATTSKVGSVVVENGGSGYTSKPTVGFSSGAASATVGNMKLTGIAIAAAGSGYKPGDELTIDATGGTAVTAAKITVLKVNSNGAILEARVSTEGAYSTMPTNITPNTPTGGTGTSATFNTTWSVATVTVGGAGTGYSTTPNVTFSGGAGTGAAARAAMVYESTNRTLVPATDARIGLVFDGSVWRTW